MGAGQNIWIRINLNLFTFGFGSGGIRLDSKKLTHLTPG